MVTFWDMAGLGLQHVNRDGAGLDMGQLTMFAEQRLHPEKSTSQLLEMCSAHFGFSIIIAWKIGVSPPSSLRRLSIYSVSPASSLENVTVSPTHGSCAARCLWSTGWLNAERRRHWREEPIAWEALRWGLLTPSQSRGKRGPPSSLRCWCWALGEARTGKESEEAQGTPAFGSWAAASTQWGGRSSPTAGQVSILVTQASVQSWAQLLNTLTMAWKTALLGTGFQSHMRRQDSNGRDISYDTIESDYLLLAIFYLATVT